MKNNNLTVMAFLSTLSVIFVVTSLDVVYGQENQTAIENPKFLAIQHAQSGSISEINETAYSLELNDVSEKTILFSDRPDRIVTSASTSDFIGNWSTGKDSFAVDAPNAVLVVDQIEEQQDVSIVELFTPIYDVDKKALKYNITPLNTTLIDLPGEFGQSVLIIDPHVTSFFKSH